MQDIEKMDLKIELTKWIEDMDIGQQFTPIDFLKTLPDTLTDHQQLVIKNRAACVLPVIARKGIIAARNRIMINELQVTLYEKTTIKSGSNPKDLTPNPKHNDSPKQEPINFANFSTQGQFYKWIKEKPNNFQFTVPDFVSDIEKQYDFSDVELDKIKKRAYAALGKFQSRYFVRRVLGPERTTGKHSLYATIGTEDGNSEDVIKIESETEKHGVNAQGTRQENPEVGAWATIDEKEREPNHQVQDREGDYDMQPQVVLRSEDGYVAHYKNKKPFDNITGELHDWINKLPDDAKFTFVDFCQNRISELSEKDKIKFRNRVTSSIDYLCQANYIRKTGNTLSPGYRGTPLTEYEKIKDIKIIKIEKRRNPNFKINIAKKVKEYIKNLPPGQPYTSYQFIQSIDEGFTEDEIKLVHSRASVAVASLCKQGLMVKGAKIKDDSINKSAFTYYRSGDSHNIELDKETEINDQAQSQNKSAAPDLNAAGAVIKATIEELDDILSANAPQLNPDIPKASAQTTAETSIPMQENQLTDWRMGEYIYDYISQLRVDMAKREDEIRQLNKHLAGVNDELSRRTQEYKNKILKLIEINKDLTEKVKQIEVIKRRRNGIIAEPRRVEIPLIGDKN